MTSSEGGNSRDNNGRPRLRWFVVAGAVWVALVLFWPKFHKAHSGEIDSTSAAWGHRYSGATGQLPVALRRFGPAAARTPGKTAEQIVAGKVQQFGRNRRAIVERIALRRKEDLPPEVDAFFKAVDKGDWEEIDRLWKELWAHQSNHDRPDLDPYWPTVLDTNGVAEQAHIWPAQKLLDYGNAILDSLRPGMVYVGGTDCGRFVPELLNETSDDPHMVITQNALAAPTYLDLLSELYGGQFNELTKEDSQRAFDAYTADAQKRLQHDLDFPDEPKQVLPGENITMVDGKVQVSGTTSIMAMNEKLLQMLMEKNPDLSFATEESFPLRGTYAGAVPLGPLMELNAQGQGSFNQDAAAQSVDFWRSTAQVLLEDPEVTGSSYALGAYSHDVNATANLLAAHNFTAEAEEVYNLASQIMPGNPEPVAGLARVLIQTGHADQAKALLDNFASKYPNQRKALEQVR
jgi:tetratricopeptide repeat protein